MHEISPESLLLIHGRWETVDQRDPENKNAPRSCRRSITPPRPVREKTTGPSHASAWTRLDLVGKPVTKLV